MISYVSYLHPLNAEQLASEHNLSVDEGIASYFKYLEEVKGIDPADFTEKDKDGNSQSFVTYYFLAQNQAVEYAGPLTDVRINEDLQDPPPADAR